MFDIRTRSGPLVTDKIESGSVPIGDKLVLDGPHNDFEVTIAGIEKFQQEGLVEAAAGPDDVGLEITGVTVEQAKKRRILRSRTTPHAG